jgi:hypothetical protein
MAKVKPEACARGEFGEFLKSAKRDSSMKWRDLTAEISKSAEKKGRIAESRFE